LKLSKTTHCHSFDRYHPTVESPRILEKVALSFGCCLSGYTLLQYEHSFRGSSSTFNAEVQIFCVFFLCFVLFPIFAVGRSSCALNTFG